MTRSTHKGWKSYSFETLSLNPTSEQSGVNIIFAHGLKHDKRIRSQLWRTQLLAFLSGARPVAASLHVFAFTTAQLLKGGEQELDALVERIHKYTMRLFNAKNYAQTSHWLSHYVLENAKRMLQEDQTFIFIGYDVARWVIQRSLACHSQYEGVLLTSLIGVILWEVPSPDAWVSKMKTLYQGWRSTSITLDPAVLNQTEHDFNLLKDNQKYSPRVLEVPSVDVGNYFHDVTRSLKTRAQSLLPKSLSPEPRDKVASPEPAPQTLTDGLKALVERSSGWTFTSDNVQAEGGRNITFVTEQGPKAQVSADRKAKASQEQSATRTLNSDTQPTASRIGVQLPPDLSSGPGIGIIPSGEKTRMNVEVPGSLAALTQVAHEWLDRGDYKRAKRTFARILNEFGVAHNRHTLLTLKFEGFSTPDLRYSVCLGLAIIDLQEGHLESAEHAFQAVAKDLGEDSETNAATLQCMLGDVYWWLGRVCCELGDLKCALHNFSEAKRIANETSRALISCSKALVFARKGDFATAISLSNKVLDSPAVDQLMQYERERAKGLCTIESETSAEAQEPPLDLPMRPERKASAYAAAVQGYQKSESGSLDGGAWRKLSSLCHIRSTLARVFWLAGNQQQAKDQYEQLTTTCKIFQMKHLGVLDSANLHCEMLLDNGDIPAAEQRCNETLRVLLADYDSLHPSTLAAREIQAFIYLSQGRLTEALNAAQSLIFWSEEKFRDEHTQSIRAKDLLAVTYAARGEFYKAIEYHEAAIASFTSAFGNTHPCTLRARVNMAMTSYRSGALRDALDVCEQMLHLAGSYLRKGPASADSSTAFETGQSHYTTHGLLQLEDLMPENAAYYTIFFDVALCLAMCELERISGDFDFALEQLEAIRQSRNAFPGPDQHVFVDLACMHALATAYRRSNQLKLSRDLFERALELAKTRLGMHHQQTLLIQFERNLVRYYNGEDISIQIQQVIVDRLDQLLGRAHVDVIATREDLAVMLFQLEHLQDARQSQLEVLYFQICRGSGAFARGSREIEEAVYQDLRAIEHNDTPSAIQPRTRVLLNIGLLAEIEHDLCHFSKAIVARGALVKLAEAWGCQTEEILHLKHDLGHLHQLCATTNGKGLAGDSIEEAKSLFEEILREETIRSPANRSLKWATETNLGSIYWSKHRNTDAKQMQESIYRDIDARPVLTKDEEYMLIESIRNLALAADDAGHHDEAINHLQRAADRSVKALGRSDTFSKATKVLGKDMFSKVNEKPSKTTGKDDTLSKALMELRDSWIDAPAKPYRTRKHDSVQSPE